MLSMVNRRGLNLTLGSNLQSSGHLGDTKCFVQSTSPNYLHCMREYV